MSAADKARLEDAVDTSYTRAASLALDRAVADADADREPCNGGSRPWRSGESPR